ncbi:protein SRC2 homolog [Impatiens glandulifera]|uniref:protein SRC2 homolog n=1 Tax=Impatiens glandulifera TaxID=253017 RepID=UPI001FB167A7|nr:protein SRC2 homolog [Impatiens glandulifera]
MYVYVVVSISSAGDSKNMDNYETTTAVDRTGGTNPTWNFPINFSIHDESTARDNRLTLIFNLRCERSRGNDKDVGEVRVPVKDLHAEENPKFVTYDVRNPSGKSRGKLFFSYKWIDKEIDADTRMQLVPAKVDEIVMAYPYSIEELYTTPPPPGYPVQPQVAATIKNNNSLGLGLWAGLLGGALEWIGEALGLGENRIWWKRSTSEVTGREKGVWKGSKKRGRGLKGRRD